MAQAKNAGLTGQGASLGCSGVHKSRQNRELGLAVKTWLHLSPVRVPLGNSLAPECCPGTRELIYNLAHLIVCVHECSMVPAWSSEGKSEQSSLPVDPMGKSRLGFGQKISVRRQGELFLPGLGALHLQASVCRARVEGNQDLTTQDRAGLPLGNGCHGAQTFGTRSLC